VFAPAQFWRFPVWHDFCNSMADRMEKQAAMKRLKSVREHDRLVDGDVGAALYVNYFEMGQNPFEFLLDLGQYHPGADDDDGTIAIHSRIAMAPPYAKMLTDLLVRSIRAHENDHGPIQAVAPPANPIDTILSPLGDFEARARALRAAPYPRSSRKDR
jgi:hypothetical protein